MAKSITNKNDIKKYCEDLESCTFDAIVDIFSYVGEKAVTLAREEHPNNWNDYTGNLRSSIGYMVTYNGKEITKGGFHPTNAKEGKGEEGQVEGKRFIEGLKGTEAEGFGLVVVAGMNYAEYVQANERDVLASAELEARKLINKMIKRLPERVETLMKSKGW